MLEIEKRKFITFSRNVFIPLTRVCRNRCHYCGFRSEKPELLTPEEVDKILSSSPLSTEALFTFGEKPDENREVRSKLKELGFKGFIDYLVKMNSLAIKRGKLPHTNAGILSYGELKKLKPFNASMGLMLEQAVELPCHLDSPGKKPEKRIDTIRNAGKLKIPFTTGILVGIGESFYDDIYSIEVIRDIHENYGHIQECIIQNFKPKQGTPMQNHPPPETELMLKIVENARKILPPDVEVQVPPNLIEVKKIVEFIKAGSRDIGGISETTIDYINPESPWPQIEKIERCLNSEYRLKERLPVYPKYIKLEWFGEETSGLVKSLADKDGFRSKGYVTK